MPPNKAYCHLSNSIVFAHVGFLSGDAKSLAHAQPVLLFQMSLTEPSDAVTQEWLIKPRDF
jgi:hypothetical protein